MMDQNARPIALPIELVCTGGPLPAILRGRLAHLLDGVIVVDDVDALDTASVHALERAVATRRTTVIFGMRTARPRAVDPGDDADEVRRESYP
jgi:hypothetical protein